MKSMRASLVALLLVALPFDILVGAAASAPVKTDAGLVSGVAGATPTVRVSVMPIPNKPALDFLDAEQAKTRGTR